MTSTAIIFVCATCGSDNIRKTGDLTWNAKEQKWEVAAIFDDASCEECDGECKVNERRLLPIDAIFGQADGFLVGFEDDPGQDGIDELIVLARTFFRRAAGIESAVLDYIERLGRPSGEASVNDIAHAIEFEHDKLPDLKEGVARLDDFLDGFVDDPSQEGIAELQSAIRACRDRAAAIEVSANVVVQMPEGTDCLALLQRALAA